MNRDIAMWRVVGPAYERRVNGATVTFYTDTSPEAADDPAIKLIDELVAHFVFSGAMQFALERRCAALRALLCRN